LPILASKDTGKAHTNHTMKHITYPKPEINIGQGGYEAAFFRRLGATRVEVTTIPEPKGTEGDVGADALAAKDYSFAYFRAGEVRIIRAYRADGSMIPFDEGCRPFLAALGLTVQGPVKNYLKEGKYLSRILRPARYFTFL